MLGRFFECIYGQAVDMMALRDICERHGLLIIEDAAQVHGAQPTVGSIGDAGCFFYPGTSLGAFRCQCFRN